MLNRHNSIFNLLSNKGKQTALAWLVFVVICLLLLIKQWHVPGNYPVETDILKLLPQNQQNPVVNTAFNTITANMSHKVLFVLSSPHEKSLYQAADEFVQALASHDYFSQITGKISDKQQQAWGRYYFKHRFQQLSNEQRKRLSETPQKQIEKVLQTIYSPFSGVTTQELQTDPFLLFREYLAQATKSPTSFHLKHGYLSKNYQGKTYLLISAELRQSPYSAAQQIVPFINEKQQHIHQKYQVEIQHTGVLFYTDAGIRSARSEINTIGLCSFIGIVVLILIIFRSIRPLALALLSVIVGLLVALTITTVIFGKVHLFSLVFGTSLIGVSIDYAFHYLTDRLAAGKTWDSIQGLRHIFVAITLGLITSLIGYLGLLIAPFPGLQQLALFSAIGLTSAYITVIAWYPILAKSPCPSRPLPGHHLLEAWFRLWQKNSVRWGLPLLLIGGSLCALTQVHYDDDIRQLQTMPAALKQQEQFITKLTGLQSSQQMVLVTAKDNETLMRSLEQLAVQLNQWTQNGTLKNYQSLTQYLSSVDRQTRDFHLIDHFYQNNAAALAKTLHLAQVPKLKAQLTPITVTDFLSEAVSSPVRFLYFHLDNAGQHVASVVLLQGLIKPQVVKDYVASMPQFIYLDKVADISALFSQYRVKVMELLGGAIILIALVLAKYYGGKHALNILLPSLIACLFGLAITALMGSTLNLFNLLALVLVIGIGIDYTLFFAEKARSRSTLLAITLSAITTLLSFGLLTLSSVHAIHSFGITVLSGIFIAWLLSPIAIKWPVVKS